MPHYFCDCSWVLISDEPLPRNVVRGGFTSAGEPVFVARTIYENELLPGFTTELSQTCFTSWNGAQRQNRRFEVLTALHSAEFEWRLAACGNIVDGAVLGGITLSGEMLYVGRVKIGNSHVLGKIHPTHNCCYVGYNGVEQTHPTYEVLTCTVIEHYRQLPPHGRHNATICTDL